MCRYGLYGPYKSHYVCLPCRLSFKYSSATPHCPRCRREMINVGRDFAAPRRSDRSGWKALAAVLESGLRFHSCGCGGPGYRPRTRSEVRERTLWARRQGIPLDRALETSVIS
ncbi:hypothetical protein [Nocardia alni]|uniref:hypothetical protein n=1 Tax=Nocardia alni TaxID=2815723 RepID=UPI001C223527|nr:hypothetical protein [Nocardia alni]